MDAVAAAGAEVLLSINASPYNREKPYIRKTLLTSHCQRTGLPLVYLNQIGGQDELIFDGCSKAFDAAGNMTHRLAGFAEQTALFNLNELQVEPMLAPAASLPDLAQVYEALVLAVRDYVTKTVFKVRCLAYLAVSTRR